MAAEACIASIKNHYNSLTRTECSIADYVLANSSTVTEMNVAQLAQASGTAGSAVIRFCKSVGYSGFSQFRLALAKELAARPVSFLPLISDQDSTGQIAEKVFASGIRTLQNTLSMLDADMLERLAAAFDRAGKIYLFGVGTSSPVAQDMQYRLLQLGYCASCYTDILFMPVAAMNMQKQDIAIAISHSGRTAATLDALKLAGAHGATTAAIPSYRSSPLAKAADYPLTAYPDDINYPTEAVSARIAHLCLLDALYAVLAMRGGQAFAEHIQNRDKILEKIRKEAD